MDKVRLGILFGGPSEEHPISIKSAREVANVIDRDAYDPVFVGITREGQWRLCDTPDDLAEGRPGAPVVLAAGQGLLVLDGERHRTIPLDVILPVLHGRFGEDGAIQGMLEWSGIPYVGCDIPSSALCMDKSLAYVVVRAAGIGTPEFWIVDDGEQIDPSTLSYPVFVKPARSGSSFGVSKVAGPGELADAIETARRFDAKVLIEGAVAGREIGCAVLGNVPDLTVGEVDRIALSGGFFRVHQEATPELGSDNSTPIVPADISPALQEQAKQTAQAIYRSLGCGGLARVDMFLTDDGRIILNEVNTMPGLTTYSRYPRMMAAAGIPLAEVLHRAVQTALTEPRR